MKNFVYLKSRLLLILTMLNIYSIWAQHTSFTAITSGTRDSSADKGATYFLSGNGPNGRLNMSNNTVWIVGDNTHIVYNGNTNHSFMNGEIRSTGLVFVAKPTGGGRVDFSSPNGGMKATDITYYYLGDGNIFNHLENGKNAYKGFVRFIFDMSGGIGHVQFANREYANVKLDVKSSNASELGIYPARNHTGFTSLSGFETDGLTSSLTLHKGSTTTSHARFYDPVYTGTTNNLLPMKINTGGAANYGREYFTIDVTAIRHDNANGLVTDEDNTVLFNNSLTEANTTIYANNGTTELDYYSDKNVIPCLVRTISTTLSTTRKNINYLIRRNGYQEIRVDNLAMNEPVVIKEMPEDTSWSNTGTITQITTLDEFYDEAQKWLTNNLSTSSFISVDVRNIDLSNYNLVVDANAASLFSVSGTTITINSATLAIGNKFAGIETTGTITTANGATLEHGYIDATGTNIYVDLDWNEATELNIIIENLDDNSSIHSATATEVYKGHFLQPDPVPTNGIRAQLETDKASVLFQETLPDNELNYIRRGISLNATGERQTQILYLVRKILQKAEAINSALNGTTPNITDNTTITTSNQTATVENQVAILNLLRRILTKVTAHREAIKN